MSELERCLPHRTRRWRHVASLASALRGSEREKKKFPLLISNNRSQLHWVWGLSIHDYCGSKKMWIFSLNWFQLGDILRHLTIANSNLLWKKILQNGVSMNSWTLSYKENKLFFFLSLNTQGNKPPWVRVSWNKKLESDLQRPQILGLIKHRL